MMYEHNLEKSKLGAENGYLTGVSLDLTELVKDSIKNGDLQYFYEESNNSTDSIKYYSTKFLSESSKSKVDSLNLVNKRLAEVKFKYAAILNADKAFIKNLNIKWWISAVLGTIFCAIFFLSVYNWYKYRRSIDK